MTNLSVFNSSIDEASNIIVRHASFLSNIENPIAYVETDESEKWYAPHAEILELIIWNIVVAFWVNILASHIYETYMSKPGKVLSKEELKKTQETIEKDLGISKSQEISKGVKLSLGNSFKIEANFVKRTTDYLTYYGWPTDEAARDAKSTFHSLLNIAQAQMAEKPEEDETKNV